MLQIKNTLGGGKPEGLYVWKKYEYTSDPYLSFLGNEEFTLKTNTYKNWDGTLEYSTDTTTWSTWDGTPISSSGKKLYLRGTGNSKIAGISNSRFIFTGADTLRVSCEGNIEYLLDYETVRAGNHPTMAANCYAYMFKDCTSLTTAPELPAITLANNCYYYMFQGCTSLITSPELPATTLANSCYYSMFQGCTSLITAPELPATTLAVECYFNMFYNCTSLTIPPIMLPATTLADSCYSWMFSCTAIDTIPEIMATTYAASSCEGMFDNIKTLNAYSTSGTDHTYGWTAPTPAVDYCSGMFGSDDGQSEWAKLDGSNFPNNGTPTDGTTYYFKTVA